MRVLCLFFLVALAAAADSVAFATFTADPCTTLTVRVVGAPAPAVLRWRHGDGAWTAATAAQRAVAGTPLTVAEITATGLAPGAVVEVEDHGRWRTLRDRLDPPLRLAMGGDMMHEPRLLEATCRAVAARDPEAAVIGGDWAYDNGEPRHAGRWIALLAIWARTMVRADGTGVPMIAAIGNHEVAKDGRAGTAWAALFPEPTYRALDIGSQVSVLLLDTGHLAPIDGIQAAWLAAALRERAGRQWRFAAYHVPAYASVREPDDWNAPRIRAAWVPLFERHGLAAAFEHHDHALKRSHPLIGGIPTPGGVLYLGDGAWGVGLRPPKTPAQRPWLAHTAAAHHAWLLEIGSATAAATAVGPDGELDRTLIPPRMPTP